MPSDSEAKVVSIKTCHQTIVGSIGSMQYVQESSCEGGLIIVGKAWKGHVRLEKNMFAQNSRTNTQTAEANIVHAFIHAP